MESISAPTRKVEPRAPIANALIAITGRFAFPERWWYLWFSLAALAAMVLGGHAASAQTWTKLHNTVPFNASTALLLTDGTVMVAALGSTDGYGNGQWWKLTPDSTGSYVNGSWSQLASLPSGYTPLYFASAVLTDGRVLVEGGEYNGSSESETNLGAIYKPTTNTWSSISPPSGWASIGDGQSVVLPNGTFMLGNCDYPPGLCGNSQQALFNASSLTWTAVTPTGKADPKSEEGWTLLPSGYVLTVDTEDNTNSELYNSSTEQWTSAGSTGNSLVNASCGSGFETGPAVLLPGGTVFALGGLSYTSVYHTAGGTWSNGPQLPSGLGVDDGPAAILPDGNVLVMAAPYNPCYSKGSTFYEFNGSTLTQVPSPPNASIDKSYYGRMLVLPTGQVLFTDGSSDVEIYTAAGTYQSSWQPVISSVPKELKPGGTYTIDGSQLNGLSQGAMYGDDAQMASNYPIVQITNSATGNVYFARSFSFSTMSVAPNATGSAQFSVPSNIKPGASELVVIANGIPSEPVKVVANPGALLAPIINLLLN